MGRKRNQIALAIALIAAAAMSGQTAAPNQAGPERWTKEKADSWYAQQAWLVGSNYIPADASNELEMWQASTFDAKRIDKELGWAEGLGMNTMRVFLHDLPWEQDQAGFKHRINKFLEICDRHKIRPVFVLFDSCWDPHPKLGKQARPRPGIHNSRWVQSPGVDALQDASQSPRLEAYVKGVVAAFGQDRRVLAWDIWNEPDNTNDSSYGKEEPPNKIQLVLALLPQAFSWARVGEPVTAADQRSVARRLVRSREIRTHGEAATGALGRGVVP